jgi:hypothetical protein
MAVLAPKRIKGITTRLAVLSKLPVHESHEEIKGKGGRKIGHERDKEKEIPR